MATIQETMQKMEEAAVKYEAVADAGEQVLISEGEKDIPLPDGTTTPNLNKRIANTAKAVSSVNGKTGNVVLTREDLGLKSDEMMARDLKEDRFVITEDGRTQREKNTDNISLYDFGYIGDGALHLLSEKFPSLIYAQVVYPTATSLTDSIDTVAVQKAIDYCKTKGKTTKISVPSGTSIHNKEIIWKSYAYFEGVNYHDTVFKKATGFNGRLIVSENFDSITGTDASLTGKPIINFGIDKIKLDGQYIVNDQYVNNFGKGNLFIYGTKYKLNVKSINTDGVGVWLEYSGNEDFINDVVRDADVNVIAYDTAEEGFIFKGAPDITLGKIFQKGAGKITTTDPRNSTLWSSKNYPNQGRIDGVVFDQGAEIDMLHSFGNSVGYGVRMIKGRINANLLISESNLGGFDFEAPVYGIISKLQMHNIKGGVTYTETPHESAGKFSNLDNKTNQGLIFSEVRSDHSGSGQTGQNHVTFKGFGSSIGTLRINGYGKGGHGVYFDEASFGNTVENLIVNNIVGVSGFDSLESASVVRNSNNSSRSNYILDGNVTTAPVGLRTIGINPRLEKINLMGTLIKKPFDGVAKTNQGQRWNIDFSDTSNVLKTTNFSGQVAFDPTILTQQELTIAHNLLHAPQMRDVQLTIGDSPTGMLAGSVQYFYVLSVNDTEIKIAVRMSVANGVNTSPFISVNCKI